MTFNEKITNRILYFCDIKGMSVNKLATLSGVTQSTIDSIIKGKSKSPSLLTLKKICVGLDITLKEFLDSPEFEEIDDE
ncbi:XRE family transcriptional regulator [Brevibacillus laterosporus]|uniref:XRE family transcriptional regulator n=1 Tax=Brevibacillus laterosporus TaxID=1465 RepID=A0A518V4W8_BRELA|nr:XRE family transcriptional regulator [Brevibacillus laterosporus]